MIHSGKFIFIRFNPDSYKNNDKNITSCWVKNNIKKSKKIEWDNRLLLLKDTIKYWCENISDKTIILSYLFYDKVFTSV